jgi:SAM-dependent methyltransferase
VSRWLVEALDPQPGQQVLELAAGPGETGFLVAQRIGPSGHLVSTDQSEEMVEAARRRAAELGLQNVDFLVLDAQHMGLDYDSFDAAVCRWGYMLMGDPDSALRETHRVLREGGRLALATWDTPDRNLWMSTPVIQLVRRGAIPPPDPSAPTPFALADPGQLAQRLREAGFNDVQTGTVEFANPYASFEEYWEMTIALAAPIRAALDGMDDQAIAELRGAISEALTTFASDDGRLAIPASAVVASAVA